MCSYLHEACPSHINQTKILFQNLQLILHDRHFFLEKSAKRLKQVLLRFRICLIGTDCYQIDDFQKDNKMRILLQSNASWKGCKHKTVP